MLDNMNANQKLVIVWGAVVIFLMMIFPPFHRPHGGGVLVGVGYYFLFMSPFNAFIDIATLIVQWVATFIITGAAYVVVPPTNEKQLFNESKVNGD